MHDHGKSDSPVVPAKPPNKARAAEVVEERGLAEGNTDDPTRSGRRAGSGVPSGLARVREAARVMHPYPEARFDARHPRQEPSAVVPHAGICAGGRP
jgi:hypothetical protein